MILPDFTRPWALLLLLLLFPVWIWHKESLSQMPSLRKKLVLLLRVIIFLCIIFSLSGLRLRIPHNNMSILFVTDVSLSVPVENREEARNYIKEQCHKLALGDKAGIIVFGKDALLEENLSSEPEISRFSSIVEQEYTDISKALLLASGVFPEDTLKRIVLITDGNENLGKAEQQAKMLTARGIEVYCLPLEEKTFSEVLISRVESPPRSDLREPYILTIEVDSSKNTQALLNIFCNNRLIARESVELSEGKNIFTLPQKSEEAGNFHYKALIESEEDRFAQNNQGESMTFVEGRPAILYIHSDPMQKDTLPKVLSHSDIIVDSGGLERLPSHVGELLAYNAVIFNNVNGLALSQKQMNMIESFVKDLGGGFLMIGGDKSFGAGGYYDTPVANILPVDLDIKKRIDLPSLAMVICIDKSGSMSETTGHVEKMRLAREGAIAAIEMLNPHDQAGVIAFDYASKWVSALQPVGNKESLINEIAAIRAGGGTSTYPALEDAYIALKSAQAATKHVILLTDGRSEPGQFQEIAEKMTEAKITISTVGVGKDTDVPFLQELAVWGKGRFYYTDEASLLPRIFVQESLLAHRSALIEEPFKPSPAGPSAFLKGINTDQLPPLTGYVASSPRERAGIILETHRRDPLLAYWRIGLGKAAAFTSDDGLRWGKEWLQWEDYGRFWMQTVRWILPEAVDERLTPHITVEGDTGFVTAKALNENGQPANFLDLTAVIIPPQGETLELPLEQTASGFYESRFSIDHTGTYILNVKDNQQEGYRGAAIQTFSVPYPEEFKTFGTNYHLLNQISEITGGKIISPQDNIFEKGSKTTFHSISLWENLMLLSLLLFPLDIALRRVYLPEGFWDKLFAGSSAKVPDSKTESETMMKALKRRKEAVQESTTKIPAALLQQNKGLDRGYNSNNSLSFISNNDSADKISTNDIISYDNVTDAHQEEKTDGGKSSDSNTLSRLKKLKKKIRE